MSDPGSLSFSGSRHCRLYILGYVFAAADRMQDFLCCAYHETSKEVFSHEPQPGKVSESNAKWELPKIGDPIIVP